MNTIVGTKQYQSQLFLEDGTRIPVTGIRVVALPVLQVKSPEKEGYSSVQVGFGVANKKHVSRGFAGHVAKAKVSTLPKRVLEIRLADGEVAPEIGSVLKLQDVLKPGDIIKVTGVSKGKGFAGGVKRHNFKGGPRTHGQSDRERAPGSLGQTTTPGRVYKGKRMAGHMGVDIATVTNLLVVAVDDEMVKVKGLVPGGLRTMVRIEKTGEAKKFVQPLSLKEEVAVEPAVEEKVEVSEEIKADGKVEAVAAVEETGKEESASKTDTAKEENGESK